jgi:hypothetical protein
MNVQLAMQWRLARLLGFSRTVITDHATSLRIYREKTRAMLGASLLCFALILAGLASTSQAQTPYYQGKQIRLIIGSSPGGGYDLWPRMMLRYLTKHIPGNPEIVPQNMPGAGGVVGANYV